MLPELISFICAFFFYIKFIDNKLYFFLFKLTPKKQLKSFENYKFNQLCICL